VPRPPESIEMIRRLVAMDTTSRNSNLEIIDFIADHLERLGVRGRLVHDETGRKANLYATLGPTDKPGIALSGHTDVVPVDGQVWSADPFTLIERDGKLYGRGACDMKGYLACVLAMVPDFKTRNLATPLHIAFSYDEEVGCTGVRPMVAELGNTLPLPRMVLVGEPTTMAVVDAHKGPMRWVVRLTGKAAHSSMPHLGVNAITYAGHLLGELARIEEELKATGLNERFDPPYTTLQVTQMAGGNASNIVPAACWFGWEIRRLPGFDGKALDTHIRRFAEEHCEAPMRAADPGAGVSIELTNEVPPFQADTRSQVVPLALKLAQQNDTFAVCYATEASLFQGGGAPAVVCGPGNIAQAHTPDEYLEISELEKCLAFLARLADWAEGA
jgi:acetylornithine deacetylase